MTGDLQLTTKFLLPPGDDDVMHKLNLEGSFHISRARFQGGGVQGKINELSSRARGKADDETPDNVASDLRGAYVMKNGADRVPLDHLRRARRAHRARAAATRCATKRSISRAPRIWTRNSHR